MVGAAPEAGYTYLLHPAKPIWPVYNLQPVWAVLIAGSNTGGAITRGKYTDVEVSTHLGACAMFAGVYIYHTRSPPSDLQRPTNQTRDFVHSKILSFSTV